MRGKMPLVMSLESTGAQNYKVENLGVWSGERCAFTRPPIESVSSVSVSVESSISRLH